MKISLLPTFGEKYLVYWKELMSIKETDNYKKRISDMKELIRLHNKIYIVVDDINRFDKSLLSDIPYTDVMNANESKLDNYYLMANDMIMNRTKFPGQL